MKNGKKTALIGIGVGIIVGVLLSLLVVWFVTETAPPVRGSGRAERLTTEPGKVDVLPNKPGDKVGDGAGDKPRFDFYQVLPGDQTAGTAPGSATAKPGKPDEPLWLQVGAFQKPAEANNLKAKLALIGLDAGVQEVDLPEKGKVYRVRTGPFATADALSKASALLAQNGIQATQVKTK